VFVILINSTDQNSHYRSKNVATSKVQNNHTDRPKRPQLTGTEINR